MVEAVSFRLMPFMLRSLRIVLVAVAVLATILSGVRGAFAEPPCVGPTMRGLDADAFDGSREDDSGMRSETLEEDDAEEQDDREIHLAATTSLADGLDAMVGRVSGSPRQTSPHARQAAALGRGPPTAR